MFNRYFGNYLLSKRIISSDKLKTVLEQQNEGRVKLGVLAIESGYMKAEQVTKIHDLQVKKDRRFGELAIEEGFLTDPQLMTLLSKQKESHIMLGQILVDEGMLTYEAYETLLEDYKKESGFTEEELEVLKRNDTDAIVDIFMKMDRSDDVALFQEYVELFVRNLVRFIDRDVIISKPYVTPRYAFENYASQEIVGSNKIQTGISADESAFTIFAGIYAEEAITEVDDLAKDAIGEFMNCQNGLFISNLYHRNINYDLDPQVFESNGTLQERNQLFVLPCELTFGKIDIIFNL